MATILNTETELPLPPPKLRLMQDSDEEFVRSAAHLAALTYRLGLQDDDELLDVGCGVGRLAVGLLSGTGFKGRYVGFDVMRRQVRWARRNLTPLAQDFHFRHADVFNSRYNAQGTIDPKDFRFPARDAGFHFATLYSVFTHFYGDDIQRYLRELHRVMRPGGTVLATWFVFDDETRTAAATTSAYPMEHTLDETTIYNDADDPLRAIAFHERMVRAWVADSGLDIIEIEHGRWNGGPGPEFQDIVLLRKPAVQDRSLRSRVLAKLPPRLHQVLRRVVRRPGR